MDLSENGGYGDIEQYMSRAQRRMLKSKNHLDRGLAIAGIKGRMVDAKNAKVFRERFGIVEDEMTIGRKALDLFEEDVTEQHREKERPSILGGGRGKSRMNKSRKSNRPRFF